MQEDFTGIAMRQIRRDGWHALGIQERPQKNILVFSCKSCKHKWFELVFREMKVAENLGILIYFQCEMAFKTKMPP